MGPLFTLCEHLNNLLMGSVDFRVISLHHPRTLSSSEPKPRPNFSNWPISQVHLTLVAVTFGDFRIFSKIPT